MTKPTYFTKKKLHQQITVALLGASALLIGTSSYAATVGTQYINSPNQILELNDGDTVQANAAPPSSGYFAGIYGGSASNNLILNLGTGSSILSDTGADTTNAAIGIYVRGPNTQINAEQVMIDVSGNSANGIASHGLGSTVDLGSNSTIKVNTTGTSSSGKGVDLRDSSLIANQLTIDAKGTSTVGIYAANSFNIDLGSNSIIKTDGQNSAGVQLFGSATPSTFNANALTIETKGAGSTAFEIYNGSNITASIGANSHIRAESAGGLSVYGTNTLDFIGTAAQRNSIYSGGDNGIFSAVSASAGGVINVKNTDITLVSDHTAERSGLVANAATINAENTSIHVTNSGTAVRTLSSGTVNLSGETVIKLDNTDFTEATAMFADSGAIVGTGKMTIEGSIFAHNSGLINLEMASGSKFTGRAYADTASTGQIDLNLGDSAWDMTDDSIISELTINNGMVTFDGTQAGTSLTTQNLGGDHGTFNMRANVVEGTGDKIIITGSSSGDHLINVKNDKTQATKGNETLTLVETANGGGQFDLTNKSELGGYLYKLRQNGNDWELYSNGELSPDANKTLSFLNTSYLLNYAETQTLLQRMGELRQSENNNGDVWVRAFTGKFDSFGSGKLSGFDMDYTGVQVGADKRLNINGANVYLGVMGGTSKTDNNYKEGDGNVTGYHAGLYGSYVAENDFYVDTVLKYSHFKNSFNVNTKEHGRLDSNVGSDGYGLSVEVGKRFYIDPSKSGYYIEPQAQLSYAHQGSASTNVDGLRVNMDSYDSTLGRVSAVAGYAVKNGKNPMNVYFKTGYVTEMSGKTSYSLNDSKENHDFGGDWWENSIGITAQLNKAHNLYLEGTYSSGSKFNQTQVNAGYRYSF